MSRVLGGILVSIPLRSGPHQADNETQPWSPDQGEETSVSFPDPDPYESEIAAMESCILDGASPIVPLSLSRQILQTILALYRSAESGRPVSLPAI